MLDIFAMGSDVAVEEEKDVLGGGGAKESGVYPMTLKYAYLDVSKPNAATGGKGGAHNVNLVFKDGDREVKFQEYVTSGLAKGSKPYYEKDGKKFPLPGYSKMDNMLKLITGKGLAEQEFAEKTIKVWSNGAEVNEPRKVLTDTLNIKMQLGLLKVMEDKYSTPTESRTYNEVSKFFNEDGQTVQELTKSEPATFLDKWAKANLDKVVDKRKKSKDGGAVSGAPAGGAAAVSAAADLFSA